MKTLVDQHGRRVRKLRLSLTDKCNLRCHYCMPLDATFMDEKNYLSPDEYFTIIQDLTSYGLEELRLTGGEPLLRKSFRDIIQKLSTLPLKKIGMTTNGIFLDKHLDDLKASNVHHLNVSLDSLEPKTFHKITYGNHLNRILKNIDLAQKMGLHIKINVVALRGINDHELFDFVHFSNTTGIEVRFLEMMRIGEACSTQNDQYISATDMITKLKTKYELKSIPMEKDSTSFNYRIDGAQIGFIASEGQAFCGQCSRWRLSADGIMRACLFKDDGLSIKNKNASERETIYHSLLEMKPFMRPAEVTHLMHAIGG
jgi:cyclic pyranopterin phosphate synthase